MKKLFLFLVFATTSIVAQVSPKSNIYQTIIKLDSLLFSVGFNTCDINQFKNLYSEDFEFFHDKDSISNKKTFLYNLKNGLCGSPDNYQARRELVKGSTNIYPLYNKKKLYGAIQTGTHLFFESIKGQKERFGSSADFTHVWQLKNNRWKLTRSLSYNHQAKMVHPKIDLENSKNLELWLKENNIPTLGLGIIKQGKLQEIKVIGKLNNGERAPYNTIFNVASLTKPVTAVVALKLISQGKWKLDKPLYKYWVDPDVKDDARVKKLTTRHVLSHQTGFPNWRNKKLQFLFTPGTKYQYSGEGMEYLRRALEKKFKKSLNELASELIFEPLGMTDTQYVWNDKIDESRVVAGYNPKGDVYKTHKRQINNAADDLLTTIPDYATFILSSINDKGLSSEMHKPQVASNNGKHFGLGFERYDFKDGNYALSHGGADRGAQTIFFYFPRTQQGILIFTNVDDGYKVYEKLLTHYLGNYGKEIIAIEMGKK
ncbi:serine hydrolase [Wenyingzhuangia sp. IMCC45574]